MNITRSYQSMFKIPELKRRILFTALILVVYRLGSHVPVPGIDREALAQFFAGLQGSLAGLYDMFSGGNLHNATIFALGIMPYISASIILQLLQAVVPYFEKLAKEGEEGRKKINQYTRYGTVGLALVQAFGMSFAVEGLGVVANPGLAFKLLFMLTLTAGTVLVMWLGEQITERGIGNGISLIIFIGIIARYPSDTLRTFEQMRSGEMHWLKLAVIIAFMVGGDRGRHRHHPGPAQDPGAVREEDRRPAHLWRRQHAHPAAGQHRRRDPDHLRAVDHHVPGDAGRVLPGERVLELGGAVVPAHEPGVHHPLLGPDHPVLLLLHRGDPQPRRSRGQHEEEQRLHPRRASGQEDRRVYRPCPDPGDAAGRGLPGGHRRPAGLHDLAC